MGVGARHPALISFLNPHSRSDQWATLPLPSSIRVVEHGARRGRVCVCVCARSSRGCTACGYAVMLGCELDLSHKYAV